MNSPASDARSSGKPAIPDILFASLLLVFMLLSVNSSRQESVTIDEFRHLSTGVYYWQSGDYSFDSATPPLWKMAMALPAYMAGAKPVQFGEMPEIAAGWEPWFVATDFMRDNAPAYIDYLQSARMVNLLAAFVCLVLLYRFSRKRLGPPAALFGTAFLALSPTFLAHSHYATTDVIATLGAMGVVFMLIGYLDRPSAGRLAGVSLALALSLLCKFSALLVVPLVLLVVLLVAFRQTEPVARIRQRLLMVVVPSVKSLLLVMVTVLLTLNVFYGFKGTGTPLRELQLGSRSLAALGQGVASALPIPLPRAFVEGFDKQKADSDYSEFPAYFMGRWSVDGFRQYYLVAFFLKESIPFVLLVSMALLLLAKKDGYGLPRREILLCCYLPLVILLVLSFMNRLNVGVRYLLPAYPFLSFFVSRLHLVTRAWYGARVVLLLLFVLHLASILRITPHYISYFNELAGGSAEGYRYLIDSNIDWGQDLPSLRRFMTERGIEKVQLAYFGHGLPELYGINYEPLSDSPKPGYVAVSASLLQGHPYLLTYLSPPQIAGFDRFRYLRSLKPIGSAGYSILVFKID